MLKTKIMKTKISLSIVGIFNIIMALIMAFAIKEMAPTMLKTKVTEATGCFCNFGLKHCWSHFFYGKSHYERHYNIKYPNDR